MRDKETILKHLKQTGYTDNAICKILGYLIGAGIKSEEEKVLVLKGDAEWSYFWIWLNSDEATTCNECPLCELLNEIADEMENETDPVRLQKLHDRYTFLIESFDFDI